MVNTEQLRIILKEIDDRTKVVVAYEKSMACLTNNLGQSLCSLHINGIAFNISTLDRESGWMAYTVEGMERLRDEAINIVDVYLRNARTRLEESKFKFMQLSKEI